MESCSCAMKMWQVGQKEGEGRGLENSDGIGLRYSGGMEPYERETMMISTSGARQEATCLGLAKGIRARGSLGLPSARHEAVMGASTGCSSLSFHSLTLC